MPDLLQTLRAAIRRSKLSANQLAKDAKVSQTALSAFLRGKDMRGKSLARLAKKLGLELK